MSIMTVCGEITKEELGKTSAHEHLLIELRMLVDEPENARQSGFYEKLGLDNRYRVYSDPYAILDNAVLDDERIATEEMKSFYGAGGRTVVDVTLDEIGRRPEALKRISEASGVRIIMGCGHYMDGALPTSVRAASAEALADEMVLDLTVGIRDTGIKAGVIGEIGTGKVPTADEKKVLTAAGIAQLKTGAGIHVHTSLYERNGLWATDHLKEMGVPADKICIDHVDVKLQPDYIETILDKGAYVEFDNFGKEFYLSPRSVGLLTERFAYDLERVRLIAHLCKKGYTDRILLANDICLKSMLRAYGGQGYAHVITTVPVMLADAGVPEQDIERMLTVNAGNFMDIREGA